MEPIQNEIWCLCAQGYAKPLPDESDTVEMLPQCGIELGAAHKISYLEWGGKGNGKTLICVHGVFRNSWDFYPLAQYLAEHGWRVVCPDLPGRGNSDQLPAFRFFPPQPPLPYAFYSLQQYMMDCVALIARLDIPRVSWLGTSLGGLIGMALAAEANSPIEHLILNDVGTDPLSPAARHHIKGYGAASLTFDKDEQLEMYLRRVYAAFGDLTDSQWQHLTKHGRWSKNGGNKLYDPVVGEQVVKDIESLEDPALEKFARSYWQAKWQQVACPVLLLNGTESLILSGATAAVMATKDNVTLKRIANCGHAPALMDDDQILMVRKWLDSH